MLELDHGKLEVHDFKVCYLDHTSKLRQFWPNMQSSLIENPKMHSTKVMGDIVFNMKIKNPLSSGTYKITIVESILNKCYYKEANGKFTIILIFQFPPQYFIKREANTLSCFCPFTTNDYLINLALMSMCISFEIFTNHDHFARLFSSIIDMQRNNDIDYTVYLSSFALNTQSTANLPFQQIYTLMALLGTKAYSYTEIDEGAILIAANHRIDGMVQARRRREEAFKDHLQRSPPAHDEMIYINRLVITPTYIYAEKPTVDMLNRVLRKYGQISQFIRAHFRNEDLQYPLNSKGEEIYHTLMNLLSKGIKIGDCVFKFVGYSNSQKKSFCVWMVNDAFIQPEEIFNSCGKIDEKSVSKYAARYAQCFTSTIETVNLAESGANIYCNEDIIINGYNFTDGVGVISVKLMEHILKTYKKNKQIQNQISATASAIQFRYQGYKGVLSVLPDLPENIVVFRRSQRKFASNDKWMEVASISHYSIGSLNRQIIILLSTIGVEDVLFKELYTEYIESIHKMCINGESYRIIPTCLCKNAIVRMKNVGYLPSNEPFLNRIHISMAKFSLQYLKLKTKIQVKSSAVLLGISDELKILDYGEVYCKVQDSEFGTFVLTGDVIVTKNPCLYPSDIRKLKAVNEPRLSHYVNVIVFPQKGKRPHFNEISGSDLDGDMYFIYWDKRLIPSYANKLPEEPPEFPSFKEKELDRQITLSDIEADLVEYQVNNIIGTISNFHLVIADSQPEKTSHRVCKQLAQEAAKEVDSAKTGVHGEIPKEAYSLTKVYPDYLASSKKERYYSKSIIGQLFHMLDVDKEISKINKCVIFDDVKISGLVVPNDIMIEARVHYEQYKAEMSRIEDEEDLPEYDLLSGCVLENEKYHKDKDRYIKIDSIALKINNLISHFKDIYANSKSNPKQLAAAYYYISYNAADYLSFPWLIVCDVLCNIKMS